MRTKLLALLGTACVTAGLTAQPNAVPGVDVEVTSVQQLTASGRLGTYPTGRNGMGMGVSLCNRGSATVEFRRPMETRHPFFAFLLCRESNGRFEQISDRSFVKHAFGAANQSQCGTCTTAGFTLFGPNCSDTYSLAQNIDRFWLAPATEIDPWLGVWQPVGSHFDAGEPDVGPPFNNDGLRSLSSAQVAAMDPVTHRVEVDDADLDVAGARYFYSCFFAVPTEPDAARPNSMASRETEPQWLGANWWFVDQSQPVPGSILQHWSNSSLASATNGNDDGRFYVAVSVTGPDSRGLWHYEYAVHNRDNSRGAASLRIPTCSSARVLDPSFGDIDADAGNDWAFSRGTGEAAFLAGAGNALEWNTIYNFGFDSDAAPVAGQVVLDQALPGAGAGSVAVVSQVPGVLYNEHVGAGCGDPADGLWTTGTPANAAIPNPSFGLQMGDLQPGSTAVLYVSASQVAVPIGGGCTLYLGAPAVGTVPAVADPSGTADFALPVPAIPELEGAALVCQGLELVPGGAFNFALNFTNGLRVRFGNQLSGCP